ncbi:MAG TPA: hypothetical protein VM282_07800 [Acidimicrobiales bacterium]|nr:hypothetical protein [Acidimicrobiales bacterium]
MQRRVDVLSSIEWQCANCGDDGVISGWERRRAVQLPMLGNGTAGA